VDGTADGAADDVVDGAAKGAADGMADNGVVNRRPDGNSDGGAGRSVASKLRRGAWLCSHASGSAAGSAADVRRLQPAEGDRPADGAVSSKVVL
jgi:hypothetical protein